MISIVRQKPVSIECFYFCLAFYIYDNTHGCFIILEQEGWVMRRAFARGDFLLHSPRGYQHVALGTAGKEMQAISLLCQPPADVASRRPW